MSLLRCLTRGLDHIRGVLLFGEASVFPDDDLQDILNRAANALEPAGRLILETHPFEAVRAMADAPLHAFSSSGGLWSDRPHHGVRQMFWNEDEAVVIQRYAIVDDETGEVTVSNGSYQARPDARYREMLANAGLPKVQCLPSLGGPGHAGQEDLVVYVASV